MMKFSKKLLYFFPYYFYTFVLLWMIGGFFKIKLSLTFAWVPFVFFIFLFSIFFKKKSFSSIKKYYIRIILSLFIISVISIDFNMFSYAISKSLYIFSFLMYFSIFLLLLSITLHDWNEDDIKKLHNTFFNILIFDLIISLIIIIATYLKILPLGLFYFNTKYTVIGFVFMNETFIRVPGIFDSGATNGLFLLLMTMYLLSYIIFYQRNKLYFLIFLISSFVVLNTFTRRVIIAYGLAIILIYSLAWLKKSVKYRGVIVSFLMFIIIIFLNLFDNLLDFFRSDSLEARNSFWELCLTNLSNNFEHLFYGFGLLQMVIPKAEEMGITKLPINVVDNIYLSFINFGGILFLIIWLMYFFLTLYISFKKFSTSKKGTIDVFISAYIFSSTLIILFIGMFGDFVVNIQESFIIWFWNTILLIYLLRSKNETFVYSTNNSKQ